MTGGNVSGLSPLFNSSAYFNGAGQVEGVVATDFARF
jgi:hypothetical protein